MALDINGITSAFSSGDFARGNLFEVNIPSMDKNFKFRCKAANVPAATVGVVELGYQNRKIKIAGDRTYDDWTVTVYNDDGHVSREDFVQWQSMAVGTGTAISGQTPDVYKNNALVTQFDRNGNETSEYDIKQIFPTSVGEISFDWDSNDELMTFEVTFAIDYVEKVK